MAKAKTLKSKAKTKAKAKAAPKKSAKKPAAKAKAKAKAPAKAKAKAPAKAAPKAAPTVSTKTTRCRDGGARRAPHVRVTVSKPQGFTGVVVYRATAPAWPG